MPRLSERGEHYDNHQSEITEAFVARGLIWSAATTEELKAALTAARAATPRMATTDPAELIAYLTGLLVAACARSAEHTSGLQSLMRHSYAVSCLDRKTHR